MMIGLTNVNQHGGINVMNNRSFYAVVICYVHGVVALSKSQYDDQMVDITHAWVCPICEFEATFDHDLFHKIHEGDFNETDHS